jgi:hypothetical protein
MVNIMTQTNNNSGNTSTSTSNNTSTSTSNNTSTVISQVDKQINNNATVQALVVVQVESKAAKGRVIWDREVAANGGTAVGLVRKTIIDLLVTEAGLTKAGAATYYQKMKDKAGLVNHRA